MEPLFSLWRKRFRTLVHAVLRKGRKIGEFKVIINVKTVLKDAVYAKTDGIKVIIKDILGVVKEFQNYKIVELNVNTKHLILSSIER